MRTWLSTSNNIAFHGSSSVDGIESLNFLSSSAHSESLQKEEIQNVGIVHRRRLNRREILLGFTCLLSMHKYEFPFSAQRTTSLFECFRCMPMCCAWNIICLRGCLRSATQLYQQFESIRTRNFLLQNERRPNVSSAVLFCFFFLRASMRRTIETLPSLTIVKLRQMGKAWIDFGFLRGLLRMGHIQDLRTMTGFDCGQTPLFLPEAKTGFSECQRDQLHPCLLLSTVPFFSRQIFSLSFESFSRTSSCRRQVL